MASLCQSNHSVVENLQKAEKSHANSVNGPLFSSSVSAGHMASSSSSSTPSSSSESSPMSTSSTNSSTNRPKSLTSAYGKILKEDVFECVSRNHDLYRLTLTTTHLLIQLVQSPYTADTLSLDDLFGCHTFRRNDTAAHTGAYICFFFYVKRKKGLFTSTIKIPPTSIPTPSSTSSSSSSSYSLNNNGSSSGGHPHHHHHKPSSSKYFREKTPLVFQIKKLGNKFSENLELATAWKDTTLGILRTKFSDWQLEKFRRIVDKNATDDDEEASSADDNGDPDALIGKAKQPKQGFPFSATKLPAYESGKRMSATNSNGNNNNNIISNNSNSNNNNNGSKEERKSSVSSNELDELNIAITSFRALQRKFLLILNPKSGKGKTVSLFLEKVHPILIEGGIKVMLLITERPGHARSMVASADLSGLDGIATLGGDGLLYEVVNGLRSRADCHKYADIPLGVIAGGSGNGLARSIAAYSGEDQDYLRNPVVETTLAIARGRVIPVNLAEVVLDGRKIYSFLSVGWGLISDIDIESEVIRGIGEIRFFLWSFLCLAKLRTYNAQLSYIPIHNNDNSNSKSMTDGTAISSTQPVTVEGNFITVYSAVQSHIGSDITFAPSATRNDGIIHLAIMRGHIGRTKATQFLLGLDKGQHLDVAGVEYVPVQEFTLRREGGIAGTVTIDGERVSGEHLNVKISPKPLNVFSL